MRYREDVDREREERNYFQLERDQVHTFWGITDRQLEEKKSREKNLDKDTEDDEQHHQVEIKVRLLHTYTLATQSNCTQTHTLDFL